MSLRYITLSKASHFNMVPQSMPGNNHFSEKSSLNHEYASKASGSLNYLSASKQNNSDGVQIAHTDILKKSEYLDSQTASSNFNNNRSKEGKSSMKKHLIFGNGKKQINVINVIPLLVSNPSKITNNGTSKEKFSVNSNIQPGNCSTENNSLKKASNGAQSLISLGSKRLDVTSVAASYPSNDASPEICSMNSSASVEDSSETIKVLVEKCGIIDLHANADFSKASDISDQRAKVVVQRLPNASSVSNQGEKVVSDISDQRAKVVVQMLPNGSTVSNQGGIVIPDISDQRAKVVVQRLPNASSVSNQGGKVVAQRLSNIRCDEISFLDSCFNVSEILEKKPCEKKWSLNNNVDFSGQNNESTRCSTNGKEEKASDVYQQKSLSSKGERKKTERKIRKNHELNFHIRPGNGIRLRDIVHIVSNVENAPPSLLRFLHKILFGSYGGSSNDDSLSQTRQNILHFSGFPFSEDSEIFENKRKCLSKVPYQMLHAICNTLLGETPPTRDESVEDLLKFLQKPTNSLKRKHQPVTCQETIIGNEELKQQAMKGPYPIVLLRKLGESFVQELLQEMRDVPEKEDSFTKLSDIESEDGNEETMVDIETMQGSDLHNDRIQLKDFPEVVVRVNKARRRIINLLHTLLYGRPGSDESNRLNILEFSGFSHYDAKNYRRKKEFLRKLRTNDLDPMCNIFSLRVKSFSKMAKVIKFLHHLKASSLGETSRKKNKLLSKKKEICTRKQEKPLQEFKEEGKKTEVCSERKVKSYKEPIRQLKDFEKIRRNVECASPKDLSELNDLLFLKPSNNLDIHQQILEFSSSSFRENSPEFHSRRTLLYYMSFEAIKKMAALLEITDWEEYNSPQGLASTLLRFLMDMKPSVKIRQRIKPRVHGLRKNTSLSKTHRPHLMRLQKDNSSWENNNIKGSLTNSAIRNSTHVKKSFHEESCMQKTSVIVRRISEYSYSFTDTKTNEPVTVSDSNSDEALTLYDFVTHPSDKQLEVTIREMIFTNTWTTSMGDLINRVFHCYPKLNLTYRVDFIKAKALEVLHEVQNCAKP